MPQKRTATDSDTPGRAKRPPREAFFGPTRLGGPLLLLLFVSAALAAGCRSETKPAAHPAPEQETEQEAAAPEPAPAEEPQPPATAESIEEILRDVLNVYQHDMLKYYSDDGYVRTLYESSGNIFEEKVPVSVKLQKPNYLKMDVIGGRLVCDGEHLWGTINLPLYNNEILKVDAPDLFSSVREFYPDVSLAGAMWLPIPNDVFWTPPQLILLMAREPLKTLIGINALKSSPGTPMVRLLPPRYLRFNENDPNAEKIACDRILVNSPKGGRTFWINRETKGIVRIELPIEQLPVPKGVDRVFEITMDFPNQVISDEVPLSETVPPEEFVPVKSETVEEVESFDDVERNFYGHTVKPATLFPLFSGDPRLKLDEPNGKIRVYAFWGGAGSSYQAWDRSIELMKEIGKAAAMFVNRPGVEFYAVNIDDRSRTDTMVLSDYRDLNTDFPLYRVETEDLEKPPISKMSKPSILIVDGNGIVQMYYNKPVSFNTLSSSLLTLYGGKDIYKEYLAALDEGKEKFEALLSSAEEHDYYATNTLNAGNYVKYKPVSSPENMTAEKVWGRILNDAANPLVLTDDGGPASDAVPAESILIPYSGSLIAVMSPDGKLLRSPPTGSVEPVSFMRTARTADGRRCFAATSFYDTHKVSIFGERLELINIADLTEPYHQWVADALLNDRDKDSTPELLLALCGDSTSNAMPIDGICSIATRPEIGSNQPEIFWQVKYAESPIRLGFIRKTVPGGKTRRALMALSAPTNQRGVLFEIDIENGQRLATLETPEDVSVLWFATPDDANDPTRPTESFAALIRHNNSQTPCFALLSTEGEILSETELPESSWELRTDRITTCDFDRDGKTEWIVPTREGVIWFFNEDGSYFDRFSIGREVVGAAAAAWNEGTYLIVTYNMGVIAYKIEMNPNPETKDRDAE